MIAEAMAGNHRFFFMMRLGIGAALMPVFVRLNRQQGLLTMRMSRLRCCVERDGQGGARFQQIMAMQ